MNIPAISSAAASIKDLSDRLGESAARVAGPEPDYIRETVEQAGIRYGVQANAAVIKTADEVTGALFDIVA